jgi:hypothetical protein
MWGVEEQTNIIIDTKDRRLIIFSRQEITKYAATKHTDDTRLLLNVRLTPSLLMQYICIWNSL